MPFGIAHDIIIGVTRWAVTSFFDTVEVINGDNVPKDGPCIVACTHHNMTVDPMTLSASFPHGRYLHYWAKSTLFANPVARKILLNAGNVPVYRKAKDNQALYKGTFDVLAVGETVAIFPEGTSYTEPHVMQVKDGVSWTALEYYKWLETPEGKKCQHRDLVVVPCSIVYTEKSRYRSSVVVEYGQPIHVKDYAPEFLSGAEGAEKASAKKLTKLIGTQLVNLTINAPDWETLLAARMARNLLWGDDKRIPLNEWVEVNQTLCDIFCDPSPAPSLAKAKEALVNYYTLLKSSRLTNASLSQLPLPRTLDPSRPTPFPSRLRTLWVLFLDTVASILRLPFFLLPLFIHIPAYLMGRVGARLAEDEEESQAQNKIVFGLLSLLFIYPALFFFVWALLWLSPPGFLVAALALSGFAVYHTRLIDDNYTHAKRLIAAWRVLIGVWGPRSWDLPTGSLKSYVKFIPPPPNPWLDAYKAPKDDATKSAALVEAEKKAEGKKKKIASRHLIRHVLRARITASQALSVFLAELARSEGDVPASTWLAAKYASSPSSSATPATNGGLERTGSTSYQFLPLNGPEGTRNAREVVRYLKLHGAMIGDLQVVGEGDWAAEHLSSGDEGGEDTQDEGEEVRFVPPGSSHQ